MSQAQGIEPPTRHNLRIQDPTVFEWRAAQLSILGGMTLIYWHTAIRLVETIPGRNHRPSSLKPGSWRASRIINRSILHNVFQCVDH